MSYRVIYIEKCEYLRLYLDNLKVEVKNDSLLFPISDIQILVIDNYQSTMSVPLINKLTEYNVCTIICGVDHLPKSYILPMNGHFSSSGNILKQINWDENRKQTLHSMIIKYKILNQIENTGFYKNGHIKLFYKFFYPSESGQKGGENYVKTGRKYL